ncbi:unnamed protein product [Toxocara canis]|uniref:Dynein light chain n=1 Tax=Toxocara canis TaxID=6265 RepID=A0A183TXF5_TOXCA|nr:unnamed protein product [Toxocara canis]
MVAEAIAKNQILSEKSKGETMARATTKRRFDDLYGWSWQCVVDKSFGCYVTHQLNQFMLFTYAITLCFFIKAFNSFHVSPIRSFHFCTAHL